MCCETPPGDERVEVVNLPTEAAPARGRPSSKVVAAGALLLGASAITAARVGGFWGQTNVASWSLCDFRTAVYYPVVCLLSGCNPYDAEQFVGRYHDREFGLYSPLTLVLHLPFGMLPLRTAEWVYFVVSLLLMMLVTAFALRFATGTARLWQVLGFTAVLLLSRPGQGNMLLGQSAATATAACFAALMFAGSRPWWSGIALALTTFKPTFGLPLGLLMLAAGAWREVIRGAAVAALVTLPPLGVLVQRAGGLLPMAQLLVADHHRFADTREFDPTLSPIRIDAVALFGHVLGRAPETMGTMAISVIVLGLGMLAVRRLASMARSDARQLGASVICLTILLALYHQVYDALLLALPLACVGPGRLLAATPRIRGLVGALMLVPFLNLLGTYWAIAALDLSSQAVAINTGLNAAALAGAFGILLWVTLTRPRAWKGTA